MALQFLDIEVVPSNGTCIEDLLITVCNWYGRQHEMMYLNALSFDYEAENQTLSVGDRMLNNLGNEYHALLERFHGIRFQFEMGDTVPELLVRLDRELQAGNPMIVIMDAFNIPWDPKYKRGHHVGHVFLAVGVDPETHSLYGTDPFFQKKMQRISFEDLSEGFKGVITIGLQGEEEADRDLLVSELGAVLRIAHETKQPYEAIAAFARDLRSLDRAIEMKDIYDIPSTPIYTNIGKVVKWRGSYAKVFEFVGMRSRANYQAIADELQRISFQWASIRGFVVKSFMLEDTAAIRTLLDSAADKLLMIAKQEEQITRRLLALLEDTQAQDQLPVAQVAAAREELAQKAVVCHLPLSELFNNKGLGNLESPGDMDLQTYYYLWESEASLAIQVGDIPFQLAANPLTGYDNILCEGQTIELAPAYYSTFTTIGCSVLGGYLDAVTVEYEDGTIGEIEFGFSDWWENVTIAGEEIAWKSMAVNHEFGVIGSQVHLFANRRELDATKRAVRLRLPMESNIHLFAASLLQVGE